MQLRILAAVLLASAAAFGQQTVTRPGTSAPNAQGVQGVTGGVALHTVCDSGCGGAASFSDNGVFTAGTTAVTVAGGVFNDSITALTSGSAGAPRMTSKRALHFNLRDNAGNEIPFPAALDADLGFKVHLQNTSLAVTGTFWATTAAAPTAARLSDGTSFYDAAKTGQLPSALDGSGFLKVHEQGTASVTGTVTTTPPADATTNVTKFGGSAVATGTGTGGAGVPRVTVSSDSTVGLVAGTAVIGHVITDSTSTTAVTQASAANLNATVTQGTSPWVGNTTQIGSTAVNAFPAGFARVTDEPHQVFYDPFDAALDTTNRWAATTTAGTGTPVAASISAGVLTMSSGTGTGYTYLQSQPSFTPTVPAWLGVSFLIKLETPLLATAHRFWGAGTSPATPTAALPITDGYGFEVDTLGKLNAVIYASGTKTIVADISAKVTDANYHRFIVYYRTDKIFFYIDGLDSASLAATYSATTAAGPNVQTLPVKMAAEGNSGTTATITCAGLAVWDTGKNSVTLSDGSFGWRKATIKPGSTAAVATDSPVVVALHPSSPLPAGNSVIGHVVADTGSTTAVTGNVTAVQPAGTNLHAVIDTGSTTAVTQATGTNLHSVTDSGSVTSATITTDSVGLAKDGTLSTMSAKLPAVLDASGYLQTHEQGTAKVALAGVQPVRQTDAQGRQTPIGDSAFRSIHVTTDNAVMPVVLGTDSIGLAKDATLASTVARQGAAAPQSAQQVAGMSPTGSAQPIAVSPTGALYVVIAPQGMNPLLPRCNPVLRANCNP